MSVGEIADAIGLTLQSVSDIKNGRSKEPRGMAAVTLFQLHRRKCKPVAASKDGARDAA